MVARPLFFVTPGCAFWSRTTPVASAKYVLVLGLDDSGHVVVAPRRPDGPVCVVVPPEQEEQETPVITADASRDYDSFNVRAPPTAAPCAAFLTLLVVHMVQADLWAPRLGCHVR